MDAQNIAEARRSIWKRVAYMCRYGKGVSLTEALALPIEHADGLMQALDAIVKEENGKKEDGAFDDDG